MFKVGEQVHLKCLSLDGVITAIAPEESMTWDYKAQYNVPKTNKYTEGYFQEEEISKRTGKQKGGKENK